MDWLNKSILHIWIRFIQNEAKKNGVNDAVGLFCPQRLGLFKLHPTQLSAYLAHAISMQSTKQYIFVPFHHNHHWTLVVFCITKGEALFFDSLGNGYENVQVKGALSVAYRTLNLGYGARKSLKWEAVECPRQTGVEESGYYVMIFMHQLVTLISKIRK